MDEIEDNDYNLSISRYVDMSEPEPEIDIEKTWQEIVRLEKERNELSKKTKDFLEDLEIQYPKKF